MSCRNFRLLLLVPAVLLLLVQASYQASDAVKTPAGAAASKPNGSGGNEPLLVEHVLLNKTKYIKLLQMKISHERSENVSGVVYYVPPMATLDKSVNSLQYIQCFPRYDAKLNLTESVAIVPMVVRLWDTAYLQSIKEQLQQLSKTDAVNKKYLTEETSVLPMPAVSTEVVPTTNTFPFNRIETTLQYKNAMPQFNDFPNPKLEFALVVKSSTPDPVAHCKFLQSDSNRQMFQTNWLLNNLKIKYNIPKSWISEHIMEGSLDNVTNVYELDVPSMVQSDSEFNVTLAQLTLKDLTDSSPWRRYVSKNIDMRYVSVSYIDAWVHYMAQKAISLGCQSSSSQQQQHRVCNLRASKINELEAKIKNLVCEKELKLPYMVRRHFYKYIFPNSYAIMKQETYCTVDLLNALHAKLQQVSMRVGREDMAGSGSDDEAERKKRIGSNSFVSFYFPITVEDSSI
jgi:hypothetical protein